MQTVETLNEGLKRAYQVIITAQEIEARVAAEIKRVAPQMRMPGFRPGKVPGNLVRKMHGPALTQEALNSSIQEGIQQLVAEQRLRPAMQPAVSLADDYELGKDVDIKIELEVLPDVPAPAIDALKLERLVVPVSDAAVDAQLRRFADQQKRHEDAPSAYQAATGDQVIMDFAGKVNGIAFDGGTGEDMAIEIGSGQLIPGFEDQLIGVKAGDDHVVNVTFPADYQVEELKAKDAVFDLKIKAVRRPVATSIDEDLATSLGLESLEQLRGLLKGQLEQEHNGLTRTHMKRKLLDQLAAGHDFPVPPSMVEAEFQQIWAQLEREADSEADPAAARAEMDAERADYQAIAERRVRLGLLLSEIGQANGIEVSQQEMNRLVAQAAQQYSPQDRQRFIEYVRQEPMAAAQLRAPLYEDKVVDWLFEKAEVSEREVTREALEAAIESDDGHVHGPGCGHDHDDGDGHAASAQPAKAKAKASAKVAKAKGDSTAEGDAPEPAATKKAKPAAKPVPAAESGEGAVPADGAAAAKPTRKAAAKKPKPAADA